MEITDQGTRHYLWALLDWNIPHVCSFLSVCIHRPEVLLTLLSTKLSESTHKFCRSLQSWPVLIVMWHTTNVVATGGMIVEGIPNITLADSVHCICQMCSRFWGLWGMCELYHSLNFRVTNDLGQLVPPWGYQTLQTNRIGVVHVRVQGSLDSKLLSTKKISTEKSLANRSEHIYREAALFDTNGDVLEQEFSLPMPAMLFSCI